MDPTPTAWNWWSLYWLCWLLVGFLVPESYALLTGNSANTLSDQVWHLEGQGATFMRFFVAALLVWLTLHMVFHWFTT
jgi:hypothetical protein